MTSEFYDILTEAASIAANDIMQCYRLLNIAMRRSIDERLADSRIHFGGLFAKTDYLCKEHSIDSSVTMALNALRHRIKDIDSASADDLQQNWPCDLEALTRFISTITGTAIPETLAQLFPKSHRHAERGRVMGDSLRMVVDHWDDSHIFGNTEEAGTVSVAIPHGWQYITQLLSAGCILNIVRPREAKGVIIPELIIFQPDYLIDITSIANCFESYDDTPHAALINRLKTVEPTSAIHLGNLASQMLDEELHDTNRTYAETVTDFFRHNALSMAAATDISPAFHVEAQQQRQNIHIAVKETLAKEVGTFSASQALLEPSFFCEMLGMQGRMDLLQKDFRVLIEQKSGKGGFPQHNPDTPVYQEKHYVQMLLYMAMLHYGYKIDGQHIDNSHIQSFLLYSKYCNGLVRLGAAPELLHKAIMLRNQITWCELSYADGGAEILLQLTPDNLRRKNINERFWLEYIRPQLESVLAPIHQATETEKAYFMRMFRFVATEHIMSKMGTNTKENSGFATKWHDTLTDKLLAGSIIHRLSISKMDHEDGRITSLTLTAPSSDSAMSANFRIGDIVALYSYESNHEPDIRAGIVHRGTISTISIDDTDIEIHIKLKSAQTDDGIFKLRKGWQWAIEHDFYESTTTGMYRSLHMFLTAPDERKSLILGKRQPSTNTKASLNGDYGDFNQLVLRAKQANDMFMVIGPPGTGKTSFGLMNILKEAASDNKDILLMAYTNRAVDEICSKLCHPDDGSLPYDFARVGNALSCEECYRPYLLEEKCRDCRNIGDIRNLVSQTRIFVGTTTSISSSSTALFKLKTFDLAIIDEASQILEPQLLGLLAAHNDGGTAIRKFILIGDHKQLPAVVQQSEAESRVDEEILHSIGLTNCRNSLFERMLTLFPAHSYLLHKQGRMHPAIAAFPNHAFYDGKLDIAGLPHQLEECGKVPRVEFIDVKKPEHPVSDKVNENEASVIASIVYDTWKEYGESFDALQTIGVIVPYRNQITAIRKAIGRYGERKLQSITIDTVERYQGSQRDVIIYGFTVQYNYQLRFLTSSTFLDATTKTLIDRRLNVALTRAKRREIIVGNSDILRANDIFRQLIEKSE